MINLILMVPGSIEGNPFIIRFKTPKEVVDLYTAYISIEGNPFIIRFKT